MTELERLKAERKELDRRIKELENAYPVFGDAEFHRIDAIRHGEPVTEWIVTVKVPAKEQGENTTKMIRRAIIKEATMVNAIRRLRKIVEDLNGLLKMVET